MIKNPKSIEIENLQNQNKLKDLEIQQLKEQLRHKNNEIFDLVSQAYSSFRKIVQVCERNDYGDPQQKMRQVREQGIKQRDYYGNLTINATIYNENRTTNTDQSNK